MSMPAIITFIRQFHLGNLNEQTFAAMLDSPQQEAFAKINMQRYLSSVGNAR
ncbi:Uncharacterised protein [Salmonella enterica subsp. arizonae]|uniref:Uncharacterized protein n=1 Tax=Salmonella enterica subsp. arizonae TaxID=59203 RepID=A0A2X4TJ70_SALER|nr:Uncharacterised protein [Salmonella enterica subsp. arizonae]